MFAFVGDRDVEASVAVEVGKADATRSIAPRREACRPVDEAATCSEEQAVLATKDAEHQVWAPVVVDVAGIAREGRMPRSGEETRDVAELALAVVLVKRVAADAGGKRRVAEEDVDVAITIEVESRERRRELRFDGQCHRTAVAKRRSPVVDQELLPAPPVPKEDVGCAIAVEVGDGHGRRQVLIGPEGRRGDTKHAVVLAQRQSILEEVARDHVEAKASVEVRHGDREAVVLGTGEACTRNVDEDAAPVVEMQGRSFTGHREVAVTVSIEVGGADAVRKAGVNQEVAVARRGVDKAQPALVE